MLNRYEFLIFYVWFLHYIFNPSFLLLFFFISFKKKIITETNIFMYIINGIENIYYDNY
jgi:hypothetical protein